MTVRFDWDKARNVANIRRHGIDFENAIGVFNHSMLTLMGDREDYGEERWLAIGWMHTLVAVVVYTEREGDVIRMISALKATTNEVRHYEQGIKNWLETPGQDGR